MRSRRRRIPSFDLLFGHQKGDERRQDGGHQEDVERWFLPVLGSWGSRVVRRQLRRMWLHGYGRKVESFIRS